MNESVKIFASTIDEVTKNQVEELSNSAAYNDCQIRVMPDCHAGKGCTIGTVIAINDKVVPNTVGVDIGCGMLVVKLLRQDIDIMYLDDVVNDCIPAGFNIHDNAQRYFEHLDMLHCKEAIDFDVAQRSIGTLGGGNHFIELDVDDDGCQYLVIHSGSRNLGKRICEYWQKKAIEYCSKLGYDEQAIIKELKAQGREKEIQAAIKEAKANAPKINKDLAYLEGQDFDHYLNDMTIAQSYAMLNRQTIADIICKEMGLAVYDSFTTMHNYIDTHRRILRKGAVSAQRHEPLIIPLNMRDGSLLCTGRGNTDWLLSAPHGAGRIMSRTQARQQLKLEDYQKEMFGIYTTSVCEETIDEAPMVYKDSKEIKQLISPTVRIVNHIHPVYNFKAKSLDETFTKK